MTLPILLLLLVLGLAVVLFAFEVVGIDVAALVVLLALFATGLIGPEEVFRGFGNEVILFLASLFVVAEGLRKTGVLDRVEDLLAGLVEERPQLLFLLVIVTVAVVSAFLSNTATMAAFLPLAFGLGRRLGEPPSRLLMPLAFASILGGTCTLIGTSTNVVVSGLLPGYDLPPFRLFELAPVGVPLAVVGLAYLWVARRFLPERGGEVLDTYGVRSYLAEVTVPEGSSWIGKTLEGIGAGRHFDLQVLGRITPERGVEPVTRAHAFAARERLLVEASQEDLLKLAGRGELGLTAPEPERDREGGQREKGQGLPEGAVKVHELLVGPGSRLAGRNLREQRFRSRFGVTVLAIYRRGKPLRRRLAELELGSGDLLLVQGELDRLDWLLRRGDLIQLDEIDIERPGRRTAVAAAAFLAMVAVGGLGWAPFAIAALGAASLLVLTGCLDSTEAYQAVDWRILVMVGSLLALAEATETSGAARYLADGIVGLASGAPPVVLLAAFYLLTLLLTQPMSNQASAIVVLPLALTTAVDLGLDPRPFAVTVALAASCSFLTPLEPASLLVYGPGRYRFRDFFLLGLPLTLLVFTLTMLLVPRFWPL